MLIPRHGLGMMGMLLAGMLASAAMAQQPAQQPGQPPAQQPGQPPAQQPPGPETLRSTSTYVLGPNDQILIRAFEVEELNDKPFRIDTDGNLTLPLVGQVKAGGMTVQKLEEDLVTRLKVYVKMPQVSITVTQFRTEIVFFWGAFQRPGLWPLQGRRTLTEMLAAIGGLQPNASRRIKLTRRLDAGPIPLPNAVELPNEGVSEVEISMGNLRENVNAAEDIVLLPYDKITVARAEMIYVNGEVGRVGTFELGERESISVMQLLTMAGGLGPNADPKHARILRPVLNTSRRAEIPLNLKPVLEGKASDYPLLPNDLLYIPRNKSKQLWTRVGLIALPFVSTIVLLIVR